MESSMKPFKEIREQQYPEVRKHLKKVGKDGKVSYSDNKGSKKTGRYGGLMNRGGNSYAKVHHDDNTMGMVPLPNIHHK